MSEVLIRFQTLENKRVNYSGFKGYIWRLFGFLGEAFFKRKPPQIKQCDGLNLLNLGAGGVKLTGFVNADFYRLHKIFSRDKADWMLDLSKPLKCDDNYWNGILIEHVNEHLLYSDNYNLFKELYRTLKSGGVLRIVVPDLEKYLSWEDLRKTEPKMDRYSSQAEAMSNLTQNHAHVSVWNWKLMNEVLTEVGFSKVTKLNFGEGAMPSLIQDSKNHEWQSLYLEAVK